MLNEQVPGKITVNHFVGVKKLILNSTWTVKRSLTTNSTILKNKVRKLTSKIYCKATIMLLLFTGIHGKTASKPKSPKRTKPYMMYLSIYLSPSIHHPSIYISTYDKAWCLRHSKKLIPINNKTILQEVLKTWTGNFWTYSFGLQLTKSKK